jgi:hypothetical protein
LIEKWVLPNRRDLEPGSSLRGILLFQANFPISGEAQVTIPGFEGGPYFQFSYAFPRL